MELDIKVMDKSSVAEDLAKRLKQELRPCRNDLERLVVLRKITVLVNDQKTARKIRKALFLVMAYETYYVQSLREAAEILKRNVGPGEFICK